MSKKYTQSFECSEFPTICPICETDFNLTEDISTDYYEDGYRCMLYCPKCNYKKVLAYITEEDVLAESDEDDENL